jgi:WD40 repeat protein
MRSVTPTPELTVDSTNQVMYDATAIPTKTETDEQKYDKEATQIAQFPPGCGDNIDFPYNEISPDGKWLASGCGYSHPDQTFVVQNKEGTKWVLEFKDFLNPDTDVDMIGNLNPVFWSPEGKYLYFSTGLGYDGGGNQCFTWGDGYGLFRLNLKTGSWVTFVPPTDYFPGYKFRFSPTGRQYASDNNGVIITDLQTGKSTQIDISGVTDLSWSPDGNNLAYSVASCGEDFVQSSAIYSWNVLENQEQKLFAVDDTFLLPELWVDNTTLRVIGEGNIDSEYIYTIYEYDIRQKGLTFIGTATPFP